MSITNAEKFENIATKYLDRGMEQAEDDIGVVCSAEKVPIDEPSDDNPDQWTIEGVVFELVPPQVRRIDL